jgi:Type ISP C-terminal specificity domain
MQTHLLRDVPDKGLGNYQGKGANEVEKPRYVEAEQALYINDSQKFAPVPPEVWNFHIGGYQVLAKYLKARKGRELTLDEINNVENIANVLAYRSSRWKRSTRPTGRRLQTRDNSAAPLAQALSFAHDSCDSSPSDAGKSWRRTQTYLKTIARQTYSAMSRPRPISRTSRECGRVYKGSLPKRARQKSFQGVGPRSTRPFFHR